MNNLNKPGLFKSVVTITLIICLLIIGYALPAKQVKAAEFVTLAYEYNTEGNMEGWIPNGRGLDSYEVSGGSLNIKTGNAVNPAWFAPWPLNLNTELANELIIRMKTDKGSHLRVFFDTDLSPGLNADKLGEAALLADGQYHEYRISLGSNANWTGQVKQLRFDPVRPLTRPGSLHGRLT